jgi:hypothetical protein
MPNFVENPLENERDPRSGPMNDEDHCLSLSDPDRSLVPSHFLTNLLQNLASCHTALNDYFSNIFAHLFQEILLPLIVRWHHMATYTHMPRRHVTHTSSK